MSQDPDPPQMPAAPFHGPDRTLEMAGWGLALLWVGLSMLLGFGPAIMVIGLGFLTLVMQGLRVTSGLGPEIFWLALGAVFLVAGIWKIASGTSFPIIETAMILFGLAILAVILRRARSRS
ncbi:hypothetical protein [Ostreiculturibacter nitratireducens]|uniref:hypothetical protein n=1 Tax=Ostreiculturibacter nitratireducens TaxID=3075226 RepID=UPI0031B5675E